MGQNKEMLVSTAVWFKYLKMPTVRDELGSVQKGEYKKLGQCPSYNILIRLHV